MDTVRFEEFGLYPQLLKAVQEMGFEEATPIQSQAIPVMMSGVDVIGQAQTGTGKTAAFGIPLLMKVDPNNRNTQALVLSPTRELAIQSAEEIRKLSKYMHGVKVLPIYGGQDIGRQLKALKGGVTIIIGTPGRVMDHLRRNTIHCEDISTIVLDEADEMLNMGFREDIETILSYVPDEDRQTVLFSATMPKPILDITHNFQHDAVTIKITKKELTVPSIDQYYYDVRRNDKVDVLTRLLDYYDPNLSLVFCNTKRMVDELTSELQGRGYMAECIHGDMKQVQRDRVMKNFRTGRTDILVATDVAARGIDVDDVEAVFNYDLPQDNEYYVHRIGRTGRAGKSGKAFSFVKGKEVYKLKEIQRYCKTKITLQPIPSLDDVSVIKAEKILDGITRIIEENKLDDMIDIIEQQVNHADYTAMDIAAAFLKQAIGGVELSRDDRAADDAIYGDTGAEEGMVRLFINIGKSQHIRPGDILGAVAGESKIPGKLVGAIDMYDNYTFVEVPIEYGKDVLKAMKNVKIKGNPVNVEPANSR
ncbi:MAG: DEAD/DEAH box helicase [Clostridiales bacterium]|nr:DEAD/DEAH box helicase [Clostridiales bacterium]